MRLSRHPAGRAHAGRGSDKEDDFSLPVCALLSPKRRHDRGTPHAVLRIQSHAQVHSFTHVRINIVAGSKLRQSHSRERRRACARGGSTMNKLCLMSAVSIVALSVSAPAFAETENAQVAAAEDTA